MPCHLLTNFFIFFFCFSVSIIKWAHEKGSRPFVVVICFFNTSVAHNKGDIPCCVFTYLANKADSDGAGARQRWCIQLITWRRWRCAALPVWQSPMCAKLPRRHASAARADGSLFESREDHSRGDTWQNGTLIIVLFVLPTHVRDSVMCEEWYLLRNVRSGHSLPLPDFDGARSHWDLGGGLCRWHGTTRGLRTTGNIISPCDNTLSRHIRNDIAFARTPGPTERVFIWIAIWRHRLLLIKMK